VRKLYIQPADGKLAKPSKERSKNMPNTILVTGAAGGYQGSTGRRVTELLIEGGFSMRAFVHKLDDRSDHLQQLGAEVVRGDLLDPVSVRAAFSGIKRAYFTYPVADGLLEATTIFAAEAREAHTELVVNNSQLRSRSLAAPTFRNMQHRLSEDIFNWAGIGAVHLHAPPYYENLRALIARSVMEQDTIFLPWGEGEAVFPLTGAEDVARAGAKLLAAPGLPGRTDYDLMGETLTVKEIVNLLSATLGRQIRYVEISDQQWIDAVGERINPHALDHLSKLWKYFRTSGLGTSDRANDGIRAATGKPPQKLEEFFKANAKAFEAVSS
jgi:uncharacterized protein YbjT (DUF2867 family)